MSTLTFLDMLVSSGPLKRFGCQLWSMFGPKRSTFDLRGLWARVNLWFLRLRFANLEAVPESLEVADPFEDGLRLNQRHQIPRVGSFCTCAPDRFPSLECFVARCLLDFSRAKKSAFLKAETAVLRAPQKNGRILGPRF